MSYLDAIARFADALNDGADEAVPVSAVTRSNLGYYRGNVAANRGSALQAGFPTVMALVGVSYFDALALAYQQAQPSVSGNLHDDGVALADFIAGFAPAQSLPYLADVARLDWAVHRAHFAADVPPADLTPLQSLSPAEFGLVRLSLHPACTVVQSGAWPIHAIDRMHHAGPPAQLDAGGESVLVLRDEIHLLDAAAARLIDTLQQGLNINAACEAAWQICADFDPGPTLSLLFGRGLVTGFAIS
ncbi:hypothetical protein HNQ50_000483 [Silvimonas terrae]|uniref:Putative DNA-binding domain-containing protein n=1 Tax=Silvimonas terrae TaxID=300266 RepID=A0A840RBJ1_9NEIS|nr:DNA-binding domain-containing protein [Silvimonas terrae]MBB5189773.1 hypothetical protein [Silvimonas terrae]